MILIVNTYRIKKNGFIFYALRKKIYIHILQYEKGTEIIATVTALPTHILLYYNQQTVHRILKKGERDHELVYKNILYTISIKYNQTI